ncbi:LCP family protein [Rhizohabitans arisaemae]|uniref:LCP family protein n=1 Tax=Rhizohabitans arisaemae TaxID=2720610 RepID=UPI0024B03F80|nr:LCP family protein [Rhizohabitans arisaemae]
MHDKEDSDDVSGVRIGGDAYGEVTLTPAGRRGRRGRLSLQRARSKRRMVVASGVLSSGVLLVSGGLWALPNYAASTVTQVDAGITEPEAPKGALNILLMGVDRRDNLSRRVQQRLRLGRELGQRSDTMMVIHLSEDRTKATVVSIPRDSWVSIPGHGNGKINGAYQRGGAALAVKTVQQVTGLKINHYIEVNVLGFIDVVDSLGGIDVCTNVPIDDAKHGIVLAPGTHRLDGVKALSFARTRATARSDFDRIDRQQQVMSALLHQALSGGTLTNPVKLTGFINTTLKTLTVNKQLAGDMLGLVDQLKSVSTDNVVFATVPIADANFTTPTRESAVLWKEKEAKDLFARIAKDQPLVGPTASPSASAAPSPKPSPTPAAGALRVPPERITLHVLNGTGVDGKGARSKAELVRLGFKIPSAPGNTTRTDYVDTVIRYGRNQAEAAKTVAAALPGAKLRLTEERSDRIDVVVGRNHPVAKPVKITAPAAAPTPTPTPTAAVTPKTATQNICR